MSRFFFLSHLRLFQWRSSSLTAVIFAISLYPGFGFGARTALAAEHNLPSKMSAVTLFPSGAAISRQAAVTVAPGEHTLIVNDLPRHIVSNSVRVTGQVTGGLEIGSVDLRSIVLDDKRAKELDKSERQKIEAEIEVLEDQRQGLDDKIQAARTQAQFIRGLAWSPPFAAEKKAPATLPGENRLLKAEDLSQIFFLIGTSLEQATATIRTTKIKRRTLQKQLKILRAKLNLQPATPKWRTEVRIHVLAKTKVAGEITIEYQVANAGWSALYDARLQTGTKAKKPQLDLVRRAKIWQRSGEDWQNIALKLSTTRPRQGTAAPQLRPIQVSIFTPPPPAKPKEYRRKMSRAFRGGATNEANDTVPQLSAVRVAAAPAPVSYRAAKVDVGTFQAVFSIAGRTSVPQTGDIKKVRIGALRLAPDLVLRASPLLSPAAYLYAAFDFTGKVALLPGAVVLYRDGVFVGAGRLPQVNPGGRHQLGFGRDDAIKITRRELKREKGERGIISTTKVDERRFKISVTNRHKHTAKITVFDRMPYSEDEKVVVDLLTGSTSPTTRNHKDKRGILAWTFDLSGGASKDITLAYRITWPQDKKIVRSNR